jgi:nitrite reductase/ring-hydroxylating ferredoxin subunit
MPFPDGPATKEVNSTIPDHQQPLVEGDGPVADFREVAKLDQLAPGQGMTVTVRGVDVALFNVDGSVFAMEDACLHAGVSLGTGELRGKIVRCRAHGWRYDVTTGNTVDVPDCAVVCYPVQVVDGTILVAVD